MDKYEFKIDSVNKRIIIEDESGLCVATDYINSDSKSPSLAIVTNSFDVNLIQAWRNYIKRRKEMNEIKVGDYVTIIDTGTRYTTYWQWFQKNNITTDIAARYAYKDYTDMNKYVAYKVVAKAPHGGILDEILCAIEDDDNQVWLMGINGLKKVDKKG